MVDLSFGLGFSALGAAGGRAAVCGAEASLESIVFASRGTELLEDVEGLLDGESDIVWSWGSDDVEDRSADIIALRTITEVVGHCGGRRASVAE